MKSLQLAVHDAAESFKAFFLFVGCCFMCNVADDVDVTFVVPMSKRADQIDAKKPNSRQRSRQKTRDSLYSGASSCSDTVKINSIRLFDQFKINEYDSEGNYITEINDPSESSYIKTFLGSRERSLSIDLINENDFTAEIAEQRILTKKELLLKDFFAEKCQEQFHARLAEQYFSNVLDLVFEFWSSSIPSSLNLECLLPHEVGGFVTKFIEFHLDKKVHDEICIVSGNEYSRSYEETVQNLLVQMNLDAKSELIDGVHVIDIGFSN